MSAAPPVPPQASARALPLVATVGFAGHRKLDDPAAVGAAVGEAFAAIRDGVEAMAARKLGKGPSTIAQAYGGPVALRLLTGDAPGADRLAIGCWKAQALGEIHTLYPYRDVATGRAVTDEPDKAGPEDHIADPPPFPRWTGIDSLALGLEGNAGHPELARWVLRHCDLLVAVWNGAAPAGPGGTGETVERALERGLLVIWIEPPDKSRPDPAAAVRLINPMTLPRHVTAATVMQRPADHARPLEPGDLAAALGGLFAPPGEHDPKPGAGKHHRLDSEVVARMDYVAVDPLSRTPLDRFLDRTAWRTFALFKRTAGGLGRWAGPVPAADFHPCPTELEAQPGFASLTTAFREADERANQLSAIHRSQQLLLSAIAVIAVAVGSLPALATLDTHSLAGLHASEAKAHEAHIAAAVVELTLAALTAVLSRNAARAHRHRRWSDARRLAERLRAACATWPVGVDLVDAAVGRPQTWTEWRARAVLRAAGPPQGWFGRAEVDGRGAWAAEQLIDSQVNYHAKEHHAATHIAEVLEVLKEGAFMVLVGGLLLFLAASGLAHVRDQELPAIFTGLVAVIGAVSPAVAAAALALGSTNGFEELAFRSTQLREKFEDLGRELRAAGADARHVHHTQEILRTAAQLLVEDADSWRDRAVRRKIATTA